MRFSNSPRASTTATTSNTSSTNNSRHYDSSTGTTTSNNINNNRNQQKKKQDPPRSPFSQTGGDNYYSTGSRSSSSNNNNNNSTNDPWKMTTDQRLRLNTTTATVTTTTTVSQQPKPKPEMMIMTRSSSTPTTSSRNQHHHHHHHLTVNSNSNPHRPMSRGRLMEGATTTATTSNGNSHTIPSSSNNAWDVTVADHLDNVNRNRSEWNKETKTGTTPTSSTFADMDDSTWFHESGTNSGGTNSSGENQNQRSRNNSNHNNNHVSSPSLSPFQWDAQQQRRARSFGTNNNQYNNHKYDDTNKINDAFDINNPSLTKAIPNPWYPSKQQQEQKQQRQDEYPDAIEHQSSLYDDSGEKIIITKTTASESPSRIHTSSALGSPSRPIPTNRQTTTTNNNNKNITNSIGSVDRPIPIHDDYIMTTTRNDNNDNNNDDLILKEREMDVLARRKVQSQQQSYNDDEKANQRDLDILHKVTTKETATKTLPQQQQLTVNSTTISSTTKVPVVTNTTTIPTNKPTPKQGKGGIMGFFRGGGIGGGRKSESKKKTKSNSSNGSIIPDSPMSRTSRISDTRSSNTNIDVNAPVTTVFSTKRPSPLNVWASTSERPKLSNRIKSPTAASPHIWTALSDDSDETDPIWKNRNNSNNNTGDKTRTNNFDSRPIVLPKSTETTTTSNEKQLVKSEIVFGTRGSLFDHHQQLQPQTVGSSETNDDGTTVSGVTNPSFFPPEEKTSMTKKKTWASVQAPSTIMSNSVEESFNVNSPVFTPLGLSTTAKDKITTVPELSDDDFSDPFFPSGTDDIAKEQSDVTEAPDPALDHVGGISNENDISGDDDMKNNTNRIAPSSNMRKARDKKTIIQKVKRMAQANEGTDITKSNVDIIPSIAVPTSVTLNKIEPKTGMIKEVPRKLPDRNRKAIPSSQPDPKTTPTSGILQGIAEKKVLPPDNTKTETKTLVSLRIAEMEEKRSKHVPTRGKQRGSPYRRGSVRNNVMHLEGNAAKEELIVKAPKTIQASSKIPPLPVRNRTLTTRNDPIKDSVGLTKSLSESTMLVEPESIVNTASSTDDIALVKRFGRSADLSISSVGSDIQRLRSILRRSRIQGNAENVRYIEPLESAFATYDEKKINDPMQRAGLRLLSAAVIPIQSAIRRHLAFRSALMRMWGIVTIQAATRRWIQTMRYEDARWAAIKIQSVYRGNRIRDQILLEHCCAIEIQRHVRGLIASWHVYDEIYKIKLVQACVRRKLAMERAMDRMVSIIQVQSVARGFLVRMRQRKVISAATKIQANWRAFACQFTYQLDILDIIIVQSIWREKIAVKKYKKMKEEHRVQCAVKIQSQWRSYDCSMNYLHYVADVLITQSIVRRFMAIQRCKKIRHDNALVIQMAVRSLLARLVLKRIRAAIAIQSAYRGFVCYADYMFTISDIVLVQSVARRWIKQKEYPQRLHNHKSNAAITIQRHWRGFSQATDYYVMRQEIQASTLIQTAWRRFVHYSMFIIVIDNVIRIQSFVRGVSVRNNLSEKTKAAIIIQCGYRVFIAERQAARALAAKALFDESEVIASRQRLAATSIQRLIRGAQVRDAVGLYTRTRIFQAAWRGYVARKVFKRHIKARCIQSMWRRHVALVDFDSYRKARAIQSAWRRYIAFSTFTLYLNVRTIQTLWRGYAARSSYDVYKKARSIQTVWRGFEKRSSYNVYRKARIIQCIWRGYEKRSSYNVYRKARIIQSIWRGYEKRSSYNVYRKARLIQSIWRGYAANSSYNVYRKTRTIQSSWRSYAARSRLCQHKQARLIQSVWRGYLIRCPYKEYVAARQIQTAWRQHTAIMALQRHRQARLIQTWWRCCSRRRAFIAYKRELAARRIQASWRCKSISMAYANFLAARRIQTAWRGTSISRAYRLFMQVRLVQSLWRGRTVRKTYSQIVSARQIQAVWRGRIICIAYRHYIAARRIQSLWRGRVIYSAYKKYRSACVVQAVWRGRLISRAFKEYLMARRIQSFWRCKSHTKACKQYLKERMLRYTIFYAACKIQAFWRRKSIEIAYRQYRAAVCIQTFWRAISVYNAYEVYRIGFVKNRIEYEAARKIQSWWRCRTLSILYRHFKATQSARYAINTSALRIQTSWRARSLHKAFSQYVAVRQIQAAWRGKLIRSAYIQFLACRRIQATWRCKLIRTAYKQFISSRQLLSVKGKFVSTRGFQGNEKRHSAATAIAAAWRSYSTCQRYWHELGSVIEIQTVVRGWIARRQLKIIQDHALSQMQLSNGTKRKVLARLPNPVHTDSAARTIQKFFLMVKAEVDREVRAERKRRKVKKKLKKKSDSLDDKLLESAWRKVMEVDVRGKGTTIAPRVLSKQSIPKILTKGSEDSRISLSNCPEPFGTPMSASGRLGVVPFSVNALFSCEADNYSKRASIQPTKPRLQSALPFDIDNDFLLEEAWIDSKIQNVKARRGGQRLNEYHLTRHSSKSRLSGNGDSNLPPTMPLYSRRSSKDVNADRPPRRLQAV